MAEPGSLARQADVRLPAGQERDEIGKLDGKFMGSARRFTARSLTGSPTAVGPRKCVNCDRTIGPQHETCFYCGGALLPQ